MSETLASKKKAADEKALALEGVEALESFSFLKASELVGPLGSLQFLAWDCLRLLDDVRISAIYASDPPPLNWKDPIERSMEKELDAERSRARDNLPLRMATLRRKLKALKDFAGETLDEEAFP